MGVLFDTVKRLYEQGKLTEVGVSNAVAKGWITEDEKLVIVPDTIEEEIPDDTVTDEPEV